MAVPDRRTLDILLTTLLFAVVLATVYVVPGGIAKISQADEFDASEANFGAKQPESMGEIFAAHEGT
jgi:hypothetical protein